MTYIIIWLCFGIVGSMIASSKGNSGCGGFILGILLGPIGLLISFFSRDNEEGKREKSGNTKKCPHCAEYIKQDAKVCKYCGRSISNGKNDFNIENFRI